MWLSTMRRCSSSSSLSFRLMKSPSHSADSNNNEGYPNTWYQSDASCRSPLLTQIVLSWNVPIEGIIVSCSSGCVNIKPVELILHECSFLITEPLQVHIINELTSSQRICVRVNVSSILSLGLSGSKALPLVSFLACAFLFFLTNNRRNTASINRWL